MFQPPDKIVGAGHRSGLVVGAKSTGKTSFVVSGSEFAPSPLKPGAPVVDCPDVVLIQVDAESALGAMDLGMRPRVIDLSNVAGWQALNAELAKAIQFLRPLVDKGEVKIVGIDLGAIDKEIRAWAAGDKVIPKDKLGSFDVTLAAKDVNWGAVEAQGTALYRAIRTLNCLVIGMAHLKVTNNNPYVAKQTGEEAKNAELARDVQGFGGDKAKLTADLSGGLSKPWVANCSFLFTRELEQKNVGTPIAPKMETRYITHCQATGTFEAGTRRSSKVSPVETRTLRAILDDMYKF